MSSGVPMRRSAMESTSRCWPASPIACHCRSEAGLERTKPGRHAVDADAVRAQLAGGLPREADEPRLGAGVGLDAGEAVGAAGSGGDVHDGAAPGALHGGRRRPGEVKGAVQVDRRRSRASRRPSTSSTGWLTCPATPPAVLTSTSMRPVPPSARATKAPTASGVAHVDDRPSRHAPGPRPPATGAVSSSSGAEHVAGPDRGALGAPGSTQMARPMPLAAPGDDGDPPVEAHQIRPRRRGSSASRSPSPTQVERRARRP